VSNSEASGNISQVVIALMKGVMYQEDNPVRWQLLLDLQSQVREYMALIGLEVVLDEGENYAFLRQRSGAEEEGELPRLVARRQLSYSVSLLLALLRRRLAEFDAASGDTRLILSRENIINLMRVFLPDTTNEARLTDRIDTDIRKVIELGFLRRLQGGEEQFEVRRILKAFVDAQWLGEFDRRLAEYRNHFVASQTEGEEGNIDQP
jgi:hypothetical protein